MKLIFLVEDPTPTTQEQEFLPKSYLDDHRIDFEIWDVRFICGLEFEEKKKISIVKNPENVVTFTHKEAFFKALKFQDNPIFVSSYKLNLQNLFIYRSFKKYKLKYIIRKNKSHILSNVILNIRFKPKLALIFAANFLFGHLNKILFRNYPFINEPFISFLGTEMDINIHNFPIRSSKIIYTHNYEYEKTMFRNTTESCEKINLFIDQNLPFHPEVKIDNIDPKKYYESINKFLLSLEQLTGLKSVVAIHPRSDVMQIKSYFDEKIHIEFLNTSTLIKEANYITCHISTAILQAIILQKKIILINNDALTGTSIEKGIKKISKILNQNIINIDQYKNLNDIIYSPNFQSKNYNNSFIETYIKKKDTPNQPEWKIISNTLINEYGH